MEKMLLLILRRFGRGPRVQSLPQCSQCLQSTQYPVPVRRVAPRSLSLPVLVCCERRAQQRITGTSSSSQHPLPAHPLTVA